MPDRISCPASLVLSYACTRESPGDLGLVAASATLGLAALRAIFFLRANETQAAAMLTNNAGSLDPFCEPAEKLFKAFRLTEFNTHALTHHFLYYRSARHSRRTAVMTSYKPKLGNVPSLARVYDTHSNNAHASSGP